jgi:hypothetical protein
MKEQEFLDKLKRKYAYAYSLIPGYLWTWIFRNLIQKQL